MYSLWKEVREQIKKKAEDLNNSLQEFNSNGNHPLGGSSNEGNASCQERGSTQVPQDTSLKNSIQENFHIINDKYISGKDFPELQYYNEKLLSGFNSFKRIVGDIYKDKLSSGGDELLPSDGRSEEQKLYLSKIVPWKKGDIMISKIYRKKYDEGFPLNLPNPNLNSYVYKKILKLNVDRNKILHTDILHNYNFSWNKKKEQSEKIILEDPNLERTKRFLVPFYMSELDFWRSYFFNIDIIYNEIADDIYESMKNFPDADGPLHFVPLPCGSSAEDEQSPIGQTPNEVTINEVTPNAVTSTHAANQWTPPTNGKATTVEGTTGEVHLTKKFSFPKLELPVEEEAPTEWDQHRENSNNVCRKEEPKGEATASEVYGTSNLLSFQSLNHSDWLTQPEEPTKESGAALPRGTDGETLDCNSASKPLRKTDSITPKDDTFLMTKTQINGLNIYMDNDIFVNLRDKSESFGGLLADTKEYTEKIKREEGQGGYSNVELVDHSIEASFEGACNKREDEKVEVSAISHRTTGETIKVDVDAEEENPVEGDQPINDQLDSLTISKCNMEFLDLIEEQNERTYSALKQNDREGNGGEGGSAFRDKVERVAHEEGAPSNEKWNGPSDAAVVSAHYRVSEQLVKEDAEGDDEQDDGGKKEKASIHANLDEEETKEELDDCVPLEQEVAQTDDPNVAREVPLTHHAGGSKDCKVLHTDEGGDKAFLYDNLKYDPMFVELNQWNTLNEERRKGNDNVDPMMDVTKNSNAVEGSLAGEEKFNAAYQHHEQQHHHGGEEPLHSDAGEVKMSWPESKPKEGTNEWANTSMLPTPNDSTAKRNDKVEKKNDITVRVKSEGESLRSVKEDNKKSQKECDSNLDKLNFSDVLDFDIDSNTFNAEELEQFEKDLLNA
ncbi:hypothetical protein C922_01584 [Plasmodium inui San Antonio 1]|uniref:BSD domain-containing protein n=1 Tax=Plasmodium inui San Antonio 1 TaxID=1237626 RepID=W7A3V8_9APIC|nr:hypothetical protein C922_01584 [Plasmodium inui San Antonio 1]EUD67972.1 hypothetical protein C922_01584 [Plasmodium inui San Antonio 1]